MAVSGSGEDGIDDAVWQVLTEAVVAASRGNVRSTHLATRRFVTDLPVDGRPGTYLWWLLRYRVVRLLGRRPTPDDLHEIAGILEETFGLVIRDVSLLEDVLLTVWKLAPPERSVEAGRFIVAGIVALALLLDDPTVDLEAARPDLAAWWRKNVDKFRDQGILKDRSASARRT